MDGQAAVNDRPGAFGPGGCAGGGPGQAGGCGSGGGQPGASGQGDGGGGGGHSVPGAIGAGNQGGSGGQATGQPILVPLADEGGNGGGGGTGGDGSGGGGGGGGGVLALTSKGAFVFGRDGFLSAEGGAGGKRVCNDAVVLGNGGGGSGGAILVRADDGFTDEGDSARMSVRGGTGGGTDDALCPLPGGSGALGRMRVDTGAIGGLPSFASASPMPFQGPALRSGIPVVTGKRNISVDILGEPDEVFHLEVNGGVRQEVSMSADGEAAAQVSLTAGHNRICLTVEPDTPLDISEGVQCVSIVYIP